MLCKKLFVGQGGKGAIKEARRQNKNAGEWHLRIKKFRFAHVVSVSKFSVEYHKASICTAKIVH